MFKFFFRKIRFGYYIHNSPLKYSFADKIVKYVSLCIQRNPKGYEKMIYLRYM